MRKWLNAIARRRQRAKAIKALACVRDGYYYERANLDFHLAKAGLSLGDIGSSEEEMSRLHLESERSALWLEWKRIKSIAEHGPVDYAIDHLQERLQAAGLSLGDLEPSLNEDLLERERIRAWKNEAVRQLRMLRGNMPHDQVAPIFHAPLLRRALSEGGLAPEDIGTSAKEIVWVESGKRLPFTPTD